MSEEIERTEPLPGEWLPEAQPPAGDLAWEGPLHRILAAAEPEMARRAAGSRVRLGSGIAASPGMPSTPEWVELGRWWKPAVALVAAAAALLFAVERPGPSAGPGGFALSLVAAEGDPAALWSALGLPADPILARLAFEDHEPFLGGGSIPVGEGLR